jgi:hypothetical protein
MLESSTSIMEWWGFGEGEAWPKLGSKGEALAAGVKFDSTHPNYAE